MASPAKNPKNQRVQTMVTEADKAALERWANRHRVSESEAARSIILSELQRHPSLYLGENLPGQLEFGFVADGKHKATSESE